MHSPRGFPSGTPSAKNWGTGLRVRYRPPQTAVAASLVGPTPLGAWDSRLLSGRVGYVSELFRRRLGRRMSCLSLSNVRIKSAKLNTLLTVDPRPPCLSPLQGPNKSVYFLHFVNRYPTSKALNQETRIPADNSLSQCWSNVTPFAAARPASVIREKPDVWSINPRTSSRRVHRDKLARIESDVPPVGTPNTGETRKHVGKPPELVCAKTLSTRSCRRLRPRVGALIRFPPSATCPRLAR